MLFSKSNLLFLNTCLITEIAILLCCSGFVSGCGGGGGAQESPVPPGPDYENFFIFEGSLASLISEGESGGAGVLKSADFASGRFSIAAADIYLNNEIALARVSGDRFELRFSPVSNDKRYNIMLAVKENATGRFLRRNLIGRIPCYSELPAGLKSVSVKNIEINDFSTALALFSVEKNIASPLFINFEDYKGESVIVKSYDEIKNFSQNRIVNECGGLLNVIEMAKACGALIYALTSPAVDESAKNELLPPPRNFTAAYAALERYTAALNINNVASALSAGGYASSVTINKGIINASSSPDNIKMLLDGIKPLEKVANPVFNPAGGIYTQSLEVHITSATPGVKIFYTLDGRRPDSLSALYQYPVPVNSAIKLSAVAVKNDMIESDVIAQDYIVNIPPPPPRTASPAFSPPPGVYEKGYEVKIFCATAGSLIYYTLDGSDPLAGQSPLYFDTSPIVINSSFQLKAVAVSPPLLDSYIVHGDYKIETAPVQTASPVFSLPSGAYNSTREVTMSTATSGANIYYTLDGSDPNLNSILYYKPIVIDRSMTIKAFAVKNGYENSSAVRADYEITGAPSTSSPVFNIESGIYDATLEVVITCATPGAEIYYTVDNSVPGSSSLKYEGTFEVFTSSTIKAVAVKSGYANSDVVSVEYVLDIHDRKNIAKVTGLFYYSLGRTVKWNPVSVEGCKIEYAVKIDGSLIPQYVSVPEFSVAMFFSGWRNIQVQAKIAGSEHPFDYGPLSDIYRFNIKSVSTLPSLGALHIVSGYFNWQPLSDADTV